MPRISVLMPVRDSAATVRAAARSILRQTFRDLRLIVVDDGSKDGSAEVTARIAERDHRVELVRAPAEGIVGALQRGLRRCDGELVARMDADDLAHPRRLERQLKALSALPGVWAIGSQVRAFPRRVVRAGMLRYVEWLNGLVTPELIRRDLLVEAPLVHPAALIRRSALERLGGWRDGAFPEDYDLWLRGSDAGDLVNVAEPLLLWRESPRRATRTDARYAIARHLALKAAHLRRGVLQVRREVAIWGAGATGKAFADALRAEGIRVALFLEVDRNKIGRTVRGAPVLSFADAGRARGLPLFVAVGAPGARDLIRAELASHAFAELRDFWCVS